MKIKIYQDQQGREPFTEWIRNLKDRKTITRIYRRLKQVQGGNIGDYRALGNGLFELRLHFGQGYRIYYGKIEREIILLLAGGEKMSQQKDIKKATLCLQYYKNYGEKKNTIERFQ
jgi:putative addiction module killer protein